MHMEKLAIGDQLQFKGPLGEYTFSEASPTFSKVRLRLRLRVTLTLTRPLTLTLPSPRLRVTLTLTQPLTLTLTLTQPLTLTQTPTQPLTLTLPGEEDHGVQEPRPDRRRLRHHTLPAG